MSPFGESGRLKDSFVGLTKEVADKVHEAESAWMGRMAKEVLPPEIFSLAYSKRSRDKMKVSRWMAVNKIRVDLHPDNTKRFMRGEDLIGEFRVQWKGGKLEIQERQPKPTQTPDQN